MTILPRSRHPKTVNAVAATLALLTAVGIWAVLRIGKARVEGLSMAPTLLPGDRVVTLRRGGPWRRPRAGDIVVAAVARVSPVQVNHPQVSLAQVNQVLIKRMARTTDAHVELAGDNFLGSTDSRSFGLVGWSQISGRVVYRYFPEGRSGWVA